MEIAFVDFWQNNVNAYIPLASAAPDAAIITVAVSVYMSGVPLYRL